MDCAIAPFPVHGTALAGYGDAQSINFLKPLMPYKQLQEEIMRMKITGQSPYNLTLTPKDSYFNGYLFLEKYEPKDDIFHFYFYFSNFFLNSIEAYPTVDLRAFTAHPDIGILSPSLHDLNRNLKFSKPFEFISVNDMSISEYLIKTRYIQRKLWWQK